MEVLVHNLSHSDLVLAVNNTARSLAPDEAIARPKFSHFKGLTEKILISLTDRNIPSELSGTTSANSFQISRHPKYVRKKKNGNYTVSDSIGDVAVGFDLRENPVHVDDISSLRFRQDNVKYINGESSETSGKGIKLIGSIFFLPCKIFSPII